MPEPRFDIVTVVFRDEIALLKLQARSLVQFFDPGLIGAILVVVNDRLEDDCVRQIEAMAGDYGDLRARLRIVRPSELQPGLAETMGTRIERFFVTHVAGRLRNANPWRKGAREGWKGNKGWNLQQAFKLMAVSVCTGSHVLILDAKNHFIARVGAEDFIAPDGRARTRALVPHDLQQGWIVASFQRLGFPAEKACEKSAPTVTPMVIERAVFDRAVQLIRQRLGPIDLLFARHRKKCTEFMLLFAAVDQGTGAWWTIFAEGLFASVTVFTRYGADNIPGLIERARADKAVMFGLHRNAMLSAPEAVRAALLQFWVDRGLLRSLDEGRALFGAG